MGLPDREKCKVSNLTLHFWFWWKIEICMKNPDLRPELLLDRSPWQFGRFQKVLVFFAPTPRDTCIALVFTLMARQWTVDGTSTKCLVRVRNRLQKIVMEATFRLSKALPEVQGVREWCFLVPSDCERKVTRGILLKLSSFKNFGFFVKFWWFLDQFWRPYELCSTFCWHSIDAPLTNTLTSR